MINQKFVWDASALIAAVNTADPHHLNCYQFWKENEDGVYIFPMIAWFEFQAAQSRKMRDGNRAIRELYILDRKNRTVDVDQKLISKSVNRGLHELFSELRGADLVYACVAALEDAPLVTMDRDFLKVKGIEVIIPRKPS